MQNKLNHILKKIDKLEQYAKNRIDERVKREKQIDMLATIINGIVVIILIILLGFLARLFKV